MLFPIILFGVVWAELTQPISKADFMVYEKAAPSWKAVSVLASSYYRFRGDVLLTRLKKGMADEEVAAVLGESPSVWPAAILDTAVCYHFMLDITVTYRSVCIWPDRYKKPHNIWIVQHTQKGLWRRP